MTRRIVLDAGALIRYVVPDDPLHEAVERALERLTAAGDTLFFGPQAAREAWNVLTRPVANGGYAYPPVKAEAALRLAEQSLLFLDDTPEVYRHWRRLAARYGLVGKSVHDANVVATALAHGATRVLTLNERDFRRDAEVEAIAP